MQKFLLKRKAPQKIMVKNGLEALAHINSFHCTPFRYLIFNHIYQDRWDVQIPNS